MSRPAWLNARDFESLNEDKYYPGEEDLGREIDMYRGHHIEMLELCLALILALKELSTSLA